MLGDAVAILIAALVGGDQLRQEADRHHLRPQQQRGHAVDQQRPLVQRQKRPYIFRIAHVDDPRDAEVRQTEKTKQKAAQSDRRQGGQEAGEKQMNDMEGGQSEGSKTIKGEVLTVEGDNLLVKAQDGNEVRLHTDHTTQMARNIEPGERIEAEVTDQNHALSVLSAQAVQDRRNDKE